MHVSTFYPTLTDLSASVENWGREVGKTEDKMFDNVSQPTHTITDFSYK